MQLSLRFLRASLCLLACALQAQEPADDTAAVSVEFSVLAWQSDVSTLRYSPENVVLPLESSTRSPVHAYAGPATLRFYAPGVDIAAPSGGKPPAAIASVTFPRGASRFTLLATSRGAGRYRLLALPEDGELLPAGFVQLHNFTDTRLRVTYDKDHAVQIPANESAYIRPAGHATVIHVFQEDKGVWKKRFNNVVELNGERRGNIILTAGDNRPIALLSLPAWPRKVADAPVVTASEDKTSAKD